MKVLLTLMILGFLAGCANNEVDSVSELEEDGFDLEATADFLVEGEQGESSESFNFDTPKEEEAIEEIVDAPKSAPAITDSPMAEYKVEENDTLMLIAFKLFGDYRKWRSLVEWNSQLEGTDLSGVEKIYYKKEASTFAWNPRGNPYLIKRGNTLGTISHDVYGVSKRWKEIYNNNRDMIRDPNLIFAGFTLYYIPDRSLASE